MVDVTGIVDEVVPQKAKAAGPSVGEYFLYAAFNRMVDATSKRALPEWFAHTAIQSIRATDIQALDSDGYWRKWGMVEEEHLRSIAKKFFAKIVELRPSTSGCFMFDTTNYFTFMASDTESELAKRGKNKEGRDWLRQIGLALLVDRQTRLPFFTANTKATGTIPSCSGPFLMTSASPCWGAGRKKSSSSSTRA